MRGIVIVPRRPRLADTKRVHYCPRCAFYARRLGKDEVRTGNRIHHRNCAVIRVK